MRQMLHYAGVVGLIAMLAGCTYRLMSGHIFISDE
jgi:hypothetical protein